MILSEQPTEPPLQTTSLADEIAFRVQSDILEGRLRLGVRLAQDELCARYGVSRTPVREALRKLQAVNLVSLHPNRGAIVRVPSRQELKDVYELRSELEGFAAELAASRIDEAGMRALHRAQHELAEVIDGIDPRALAESSQSAFDRRAAAGNDAFHDIILAAADNHALTEAVTKWCAFFPKDYVWRAAASVNELRVMNIDQHEQISAAIQDRQPGRARRAMHDHIARAGGLLIEYLDRNGFWK